MRRRNLFAICLLLVAAALAMSTTGCRRVRLDTIDPTLRQTKNVELQGAGAIDARIEQAVGTMRIESGAASGTAMDAEFVSQPVDRAPEVEYSVEGTTGTLAVMQRDVKGLRLGDNRNDWRIRLAQGVPLNLDVTLGAGESKLNLGDLDVRKLKVNLGAGETVVDLVGPRAHDVDALIEAGVGSLRVIVPSDVGVEVEGGTEGIGDFSAPGLKPSGQNTYVNDAFGTSPVTIRIQLTRGVGEVRVESAPI